MAITFSVSSIAIVTALMIGLAAGSERILSNKGTRFIVGFLPSVASFGPGIQLVYISNSTTTVTTNITGDNNIPDIDSIIDDSSVNTLQWDNYISEYVIENKAPIDITSADGSEFTVVASLINSNDMTASYLAIPGHILLGLEYEYFVLSVPSSTSFVGGVFLIGTQNDTSVTVTLSIDHSSTSFTLNDMDTHYIDVPSLKDYTGTRIVSDKPLTVISGHEAGSVPNDGTLEPMAQQIPPTQLWGDRFMIVPVGGHDVFGQIIKVLSSVDNTAVTYNCHQFNNSLVLDEAGSVHQFYVPYNVYCYIEGNNSVLVGQFPYSPNGNTDGDTTMILVASTDQYSNSFTFWTPNTGIHNHISITIPVEHYDHNNVIYDGQPLNCTEAIYDNDEISIVGYGCSLSVSPGLHSIYHVNPAGRLFVMVYGFGIRRAYGYPAGLTFDSSKVLGLKFSQDQYVLSMVEQLEVRVERISNWQHWQIQFQLTLSTTSGVQSVPLTIYGDNSTVTISLEAITGLQEGQQYAIELCCIDEVISDIQDVCIHTQLLILPDNTSSSNSIDLSSKQLPISTVDTVSTILPTSILTGVMSSNVHSSPATTISTTMTPTISAIASSNTAVTSTTISAIASSNTAVTSTPVSSPIQDTSSTDTTAIMSDITTTVSSYVIPTTSLQGSSTTTLASSSASEPLSTHSLETITSSSHSSIVHQSSSEPLSTNSLSTITSSSRSFIVTLSGTSSSPTVLSTSLSLTTLSRRNEESSITTVTASSMSNEASVTTLSTQSTSLALPPTVPSNIHPKSTDPLQRTQSESETTPSSPSQIVTTSPSINLTINLGAIMTNIGDGSILTQNIVLISIGVSFLVFILIALVVCLMFGLFCYKKGSKTNALLEITPNKSIELVTLPQKNTEEINSYDTLPITNESFNTYTVIGAPSSLAAVHPQLGAVNPLAVVAEHDGNNRSEASINAAVSREEEQRENGCTGDSHSITSSLNEQDVESDADSIH